LFGVTLLNWKYFFVAPFIFSGVITLGLLLAAWLSPRLKDRGSGARRWKLPAASRAVPAIVGTPN